MEQSAGQGYPFAEYKMGCYYLYGLEGVVAMNNEKATEWLTKAVDNNYPYAMLEMGDYYLYNFGETGERAKAFDYYRRAAEQDCVSEGLGLCYEYGFGTEVNEGEAFKYYLKAAGDGQRDAQYELGNCYLTGKGVDKNETLAMEWFEKAADNGHVMAQKITGRRRRK
jgi:TPR repeat protein